MIKQFNIGSRKYKVKLVEDMCDILGQTDSPLSLIKLSKNWNNHPISDDCLEQTLYHEVVHAILIELGYTNLSDDETFVQGFSLLLHQFENTKK